MGEFQERRHGESQLALSCSWVRINSSGLLSKNRTIHNVYRSITLKKLEERILNVFAIKKWQMFEDIDMFVTQFKHYLMYICIEMTYSTL